MIAYRIPMLMAMPGGGSDADALVELRTAGGGLHDVANPLYSEDQNMFAAKSARACTRRSSGPSAGERLDSLDQHAVETPLVLLFMDLFSER